MFYKKPSLFLLHFSFVVILAGALCTFIWGERGYIHLREGIQNNEFILENEGSPTLLAFEIKLNHFEIIYYKGTQSPADYVSHIEIEDENSRSEYMVSMNNILSYRGYRFYQASFDEDLKGSILIVNHDPFGILITYAGYILLGISMIWVLLSKQARFRKLLRKSFQINPKQTLITASVFTVSIFALPVVYLVVYLTQNAFLEPVLSTSWLYVHVSLIIASYALFIFMMLHGVIAIILLLMGDERLKGKMMSHIRNLQIISRLFLYPAVFLLAAGIFTGAVWANISWGRYWGWDPKEVWALITMIIYAVAFHNKTLKWFNNPVFFHIYTIVAFCSVLMTYFGVNYFFGGMHSYN